MRRSIATPRRRPRLATSCASGTSEEEQKSSGFWIGPGGRLDSGAALGGRPYSPALVTAAAARGARALRAAGGEVPLLKALIPAGEVLSVRTKMHDAKVFIDGPDAVTDLDFGDTVEFARSDDSLTLLGLGKRKARAAPKARGRLTLASAAF